MQDIINIIVFVLVLGVIIFVHELGHFLAAKYFNIYAPEFSLGMGPKLFKKKYGETEYQIRAFPIGGFVIMAGEADQEDNEIMKDVPFERSLPGIAAWKRCIILLAGVFMNFVLAIVILIGINSNVDIQTNTSIIGDVTTDGSAITAGLQSGDEITAITIEGQEYLVGSFSDIQQVLSNTNLNIENPTTIEIELDFERDDIQNTVVTSAVYNETSNSFVLGILPETRNLSFGESISYSFEQLLDMSLMIFDTLGQLVTNTGDTINQLSGPVGIFNVTGQVTESGSISTLLLLVAMLSVNIGIFNLLPIPGLDGAHVLIIIIEKIIGRDLPTKAKFIMQAAGLVLLLGLMLYVTVNDVLRLF